MVKIIINKKKLTPLIAIVLFILLGAFNISSGIAIHMQGDGATFNLDKADPVGYGVYIPAPNMYTTMSISGSNQGEFTIMEWDGWDADPDNQETVYYPGKDVSYAYPWYFEDLLWDSTTNNDYIDPWSVRWLNVSAYNAENDTLSPYTLNTAFNYYVMAEASELIVPLNHSIPIQVDIMIDNKGPKILKFDWLTDNPAAVTYVYQLISPSGKEVMKDFKTAQSMMGPTDVFNYIAFVANNIGTYRLLVYAAHNKPAYLNLEFLPTHISTLPLEKLIFEGSSDEIPTVHEMYDIEWQSNWFKINGEKGDKFRLDLGIDYISTAPMIDAWLPCENNYILDPTITPGVYDLYFPSSGDAYISFIDAQYGGWYRYSLFLSEIEVINYNIGDNITNIRVSRDQRKAIDFTIEQDSFVKFNYTYWGAGNPNITSFDTDNDFIFKDAKKLDCYEAISPIEIKQAGTMYFYYYYFPAGGYEALIKNNVITGDGVLQISSEYIDFANTTIPMNVLSYPDMYPSTFTTIEFTPDVHYSSLKQAQWFGINITETGQLFFNTTILASDNLAQIPTSANPSVVLVYNDTDKEYYDHTTKSHTYLQSFPAFETTNDFLYIAYPGKWHDMHFNMSQFGNPAGNIDNQVDVWDGSDWEELSRTSDTTGEFSTANGTWVLNIYADPGSDFDAWSKGVGTTFDIDGIDEDMYYWLRFDCETTPYSPMPYFDLISLSNVTMNGDVNFALVRDSGYEYCDFWEPNQPTSMTDVKINQESGYNSATNTFEPFLVAGPPFTIGVEPGYYKFLVIPEGWSHPGNLKIQFGFSDFKGYSIETAYNITKEPLAHPWQIGDNVNVDETILYNYTTYPFELSTTFNNTLTSWSPLSYLFMDCYGDAFSWTQLVVNTKNITGYNLYIMQDLPWTSNSGPNTEIAYIGTVFGNTTIEFGVLVDDFTLIFEIQGLASPNEMATLNIGLSQYNTTALYASEITATYTPPVPDLGPLILTLLIAIPSAIGVAVVVVYVVKKRSGKK